MTRAFFQWCDATFIAVAIRKSVLAFPVIETFHLFALTLLFGSIMVLNLRLFGLIFKDKPASRVASELAPWTLWSLVVMISSGVLLFVSEAMRCYGTDAFFYKMGFLFVAISFHYTIHRGIANRQDAARSTSLGARLAGAVSFLLWLSVGLAGRAIAFL